MLDERTAVLQALSVLPRWHIVHWGTHESSTLLCLWVAGRETLIPVERSTATYRGAQIPLHDGQLVDLLMRVQREQDEAALASAEASAARQWLIETWQQSEQPMGAWTFPCGGYLRWIHSSPLRLEVTEGVAHDQPMPDQLCEVLVDLGWNPPDRYTRNCWIQPSPDELDAAAELVVLTPMAAFGYVVPPAWGSPE